MQSDLAVRGGETRQRHPNRDLLRGQAGSAVVDGEHPGGAGTGDPTMRGELLQ